MKLRNWDLLLRSLTITALVMLAMPRSILAEVGDHSTSSLAGLTLRPVNTNSRQENVYSGNANLIKEKYGPFIVVDVAANALNRVATPAKAEQLSDPESNTNETLAKAIKRLDTELRTVHGLGPNSIAEVITAALVFASRLDADLKTKARSFIKFMDDERTGSLASEILPRATTTLGNQAPQGADSLAPRQSSLNSR